MTKGVMLRSYREEDKAPTVELWRECGLLSPWNEPGEDIQLCVNSLSSELVLAVREQQVVGSAMLGHDGHRGWVYYLAVRPDSQRCGIGRLLMTYAEAWMREKRISRLQAWIRVDNLLTHGFYQKLGYLSRDVELVEKILNGRTKRNT